MRSVIAPFCGDKGRTCTQVSAGAYGITDRVAVGRIRSVRSPETPLTWLEIPPVHQRAFAIS